MYEDRGLRGEGTGIEIPCHGSSFTRQRIKGHLAPTVSVKGEGLSMVVGEGPSLPAAMDVNTPACREGKGGVVPCAYSPR